VRHDASKHGYTVRLEHIARLIFKQVHGLVSFYVEVVSVQPDPTYSRLPGCGINAPCDKLGNEPHGAILLLGTLALYADQPVPDYPLCE
jgi:hypothetical protein